GLLMTAINIVVGFIVGVAQNDLSASQAAQTYTILTVGDGLVSQIPALVMSTAAGVVVTRAAAGTALAPALIAQLGSRQPALYGTAGLLTLVALLPNMPAFPFLTLARLAAFLGRYGTTAARARGPDAHKPAAAGGTTPATAAQ